MIKELKKTSHQFKNGPMIWIDISQKKKCKQPTNKWKKCSISFNIRDVQIKTTMRYVSPQLEWLLWKQINKC
jgi:hypothetical protein